MQVFAFSDTAQKIFHRCNNEFVFPIVITFLFTIRYILKKVYFSLENLLI